MECLVCLLFHVCREVIRRIVDVHKGPVDNGNRLKHVLQAFTVVVSHVSRPGSWVLEVAVERGDMSRLPQVMAIFKRGAGVKHDVHLDNQLVARVVGL